MTTGRVRRPGPGLRLRAALIGGLVAAAAILPAPAVAASPAVLVGAGDIGWCGSRAPAATAKVVAGIAGTVIAVGDIAYPKGRTVDFTKCYTPTWGKLKSRTRPAAGNHEYYTAGAKPYFAYFGKRAGTAGKGWYSYEAGTWHVVVLNSNCDYVGGCGPGSAQERWLRADLAAHPALCTVAYFHHPLFSSGPHGSTAAVKPLWQDLYDAGAEVIVNGHDHDYERFAPQTPDGALDTARGIREFVVGTGGATLYPFIRRPANSEAKAAAYGVIKLTLGTGTYRWDFVPVAGGTYTDTGTGTCH